MHYLLLILVSIFKKSYSSNATDYVSNKLINHRTWQPNNNNNFTTNNARCQSLSLLPAQSILSSIDFTSISKNDRNLIQQIMHSIRTQITALHNQPYCIAITITTTCTNHSIYYWFYHRSSKNEPNLTRQIMRIGTHTHYRTSQPIIQNGSRSRYYLSTTQHYTQLTQIVVQHQNEASVTLANKTFYMICTTSFTGNPCSKYTINVILSHLKNAQNNRARITVMQEASLTTTNWLTRKRTIDCQRLHGLRIIGFTTTTLIFYQMRD